MFLDQKNDSMEIFHVGITKEKSSQLTLKTERDSPETMIKAHDYMFVCAYVCIHSVQGTTAH